MVYLIISILFTLIPSALLGYFLGNMYYNYQQYKDPNIFY